MHKFYFRLILIFYRIYSFQESDSDPTIIFLNNESIMVGIQKYERIKKRRVTITSTTLIATLLFSSVSGLFYQSATAETLTVPAIVGIVAYPTATLSAEDSKNLPTTFAQVFKQGDIPAGKYLGLRNSNATALSYQVDPKAFYTDGSLKHAIVSAIIPELSASGKTLEMYPTDVQTIPSSFGISDLIQSGYNARVDLTLSGGIAYHASVSEAYVKK